MSGSLSPRNAVLANIIEKIGARPFYRGVLVKTATLRTPNGLNSSAAIAIAFDEVKQAREVHDYGSLILGEKWYSKDEFIAWISQLTEKFKLRIDDKTEIDAKGDWISYESAPSIFLPSDNHLAEEGWPSNLYRFYLPQGNWYPSSTLTTKVSLPVFPNGTEAMQWWFHVSDITRSDIFGKVIVLLPNFEIRIQDVEIGSKQLTFSIERRHFTGNVLAKIHAKRPGSKPILKDLDVQGTGGTFELEPDWNFLMLVALDKNSAEILDQRTVYTTWGDLPKGVRWEAREEDLLEIIRRGETEEVEFKEDLTSRDDVLKTVVALANTNGGVLMIGVNNECQVVSFKESPDVIEQKIRNWVRDGCEQPIQMEFQTRKVLDQDVMLVVVKLSQDRPCWLREKGPFIRYGSNNRLASRAEVERMREKPGLGSTIGYA